MTALLLGSFTLLFLLGCPVVLSILGPAVVYVLMNDLPIELIGQRMAYAMDSFPLVAVPVFIYVGNLMNQAGVTERIFKFADTLVGRVPGGLAQVNVVASLIFAGMSGAMLADVGGLGRIEVKAMTARGFRKDFSSAVTVASAIVGPIFPPSIPLIIYGSATNVSIVQLLIAGIATGVYLRCAPDDHRCDPGPPARVSARRALAETRGTLAGLRARHPGIGDAVYAGFGYASGYFYPDRGRVDHSGLCAADHRFRLSNTDPATCAVRRL